MKQASTGGRSPYLGDVRFPTVSYSHSFLTPTLFLPCLISKDMETAQLPESRVLKEDLRCLIADSSIASCKVYLKILSTAAGEMMVQRLRARHCPCKRT